MSLTDTIAGQLLEVVDHDPTKVDEVLKAHSRSKGPLYIGLARATATLKERFQALSDDVRKIAADQQNMQDQIEPAAKELAHLRQSQKQCDKDMANLDKRLKNKKAILDQAEALAGLGFDIDHLSKLRTMLYQVAASQGIKPEQAIALFFETVDHYQDIASLELETKRIDVAMTQAKAEVERWKAEAKAAEAKAKSRKVSIDIVDKLLSQGMKARDIPQWERILSKSGVSPEDLAERLDQFGTLEKLCNEREKRRDELVAEVAKLDKQVKTLKQDEAETHAAIRTIRNKAIAEVEQLGHQVSETVEGIGQNITAKLNDIDARVHEYGDLREELGDLKAETVLARALRSSDPEIWGRVKWNNVVQLFDGILTWSDANDFNPSLTPPQSMQNTYLLTSYSEVRFTDLIRWAATAPAPENHRTSSSAYPRLQPIQR